MQRERNVSNLAEEMSDPELLVIDSLKLHWLLLRISVTTSTSRVDGCVILFLRVLLVLRIPSLKASEFDQSENSSGAPVMEEEKCQQLFSVESLNVRRYIRARHENGAAEKGNLSTDKRLLSNYSVNPFDNAFVDTQKRKR